MTKRELIKHMANDWFATYYYTTDLRAETPEFYDYLISRGFTRYSLSALGISREISASEAQGWRGYQLE